MDRSAFLQSCLEAQETDKCPAYFSPSSFLAVALSHGGLLEMGQPGRAAKIYVAPQSLLRLLRLLRGMVTLSVVEPIDVLSPPNAVAVCVRARGIRGRGTFTEGRGEAALTTHAHLFGSRGSCRILSRLRKQVCSTHHRKLPTMWRALLVTPSAPSPLEGCQ